ncbi:putative disease resistance protein RGA3 [Dendrobium catenatum]|uniref:Disease resistance RPP13-like protein 1 n=1 Tax=Dendrobium catenatum TaxID=906689 RepID=A0A2I0WLQ9_9ASPA|nr:putative disease resistance protein RGA3 [Dendrobium catenatum]PKU76595.1 Putative disease resistance RPP13-like protein 1 [Dendrobium catenatum]
MQWLRKPSYEPQTTLHSNISLLSIVGHGGMGKTTLLQHVYEEEMRKEFFDLKMWVCVSNNFDVKKVIADMLESLKKERPRLETLDALQNSLKNEVMSKKFLLVLDDIWENDEQDKKKWEKLLAPLAYGKICSRILVTTRTDSVAMMIATVIKKKSEIFRLEGLEEDQCLQLLNSHAFFGIENSPDDHKKLRAIAGEIVKKLLGSPLAAKVIGGVLNDNLDERHWTKILNSDFLSPKLGQDDIFLILRLSYMFLPKHLQNCFTFCSIFEQDYEFSKDDLVKMWVALGFIQQPHDQEWTMEDIGGRYFDVLVKKNFFDKFEIDGQYYKMHDLIHELARLVSIHECLRVEDGTKLPSIIPKTLRHLFIKTTNPNIIKNIVQFKYLHSLFLFYEASNADLCNALIEIFKASRSLRLLYIWAQESLEIIYIPEEIGNLIHLRYLKIDYYDLTILPRSLSNLYHLQYLINYGHNVGDDFLLSGISNLSNLLYVELPKNDISLICGIGKLKSLQELNMFDLRDVSGYRIGELENMNNLCKLGINCLENVKDAEEACSAKLCSKKRLTDLTLCWSNTYYPRSFDLDENVLNNLQPPKCLKNLSIRRYMSARSAIWMNNVSLISNLEKIVLELCWEWETLPPFGQLPFLKSLKLSHMRKVKWLQNMYCVFPLLEVLEIYGLEALEDWFEAGVAAEDGCLFPCLIQLKLYDCPKLKELPSLPSKLKQLQIKSTGWKTLTFFSNSNPIPLESLAVFQCPNITSLPLADEITRLAALRSLTIENCPNLISLGEMQTSNNCHLMLSNLRISDPLVLLMEPLRSIASLKKLSISNNDKLVSFPNEAE